MQTKVGIYHRLDMIKSKCKTLERYRFSDCADQSWNLSFFIFDNVFSSNTHNIKISLHVHSRNLTHTNNVMTRFFNTFTDKLSSQSDEFFMAIFPYM